jgi:hypothetical protein
VHYTSRWDPTEHLTGRPVHRVAHALVLAASTFAKPRPACGILAAGVQQRLVRADQLKDAGLSRARVRHRRILRLAIEDIAQGAEALSEIDFVRLCRRSGLPEPNRQVVRRGPVRVGGTSTRSGFDGTAVAWSRRSTVLCIWCRHVGGRTNCGRTTW